MAKKALGLKLPFKLGQDGYFETNTDTISQVSSNIQNLLLTRPGERRFNNNFGSSLYKFLFEQNDFEASKAILIDVIQKDVDKFMDGILVTDVKVQLVPSETVNNDNNKIFISVVFSYKDLIGTTNATIVNNRL